MLSSQFVAESASGLALIFSIDRRRTALRVRLWAAVRQWEAHRSASHAAYRRFHFHPGEKASACQANPWVNCRGVIHLACRLFNSLKVNLEEAASTIRAERDHVAIWRDRTHGVSSAGSSKILRNNFVPSEFIVSKFLCFRRVCC